MKLYISVTKAFAKAARKSDSGNKEYARFNRVLDAFGSVVSGVDKKSDTLTVDTPDDAGMKLKDYIEKDAALPSVKAVRLKR